MKRKILFLFQNYFWIVCISQIVCIFTDRMWIFTALMPIILFYLALKAPCRLKKNNIPDLLMICIFISIVISWIINDFPYKGILIFRFIITQGAFMTAYYIGKNLLIEESYRVFYKALLPGFVCAILGLILYVYQPGWYMAQVENPLSLEALRLRSIFPSPYTCTYLSFFLISYLLAGNFKLIPNLRIDLSDRIIVVLYFVFIVLLLFGMMRAPIAGVLISVGLGVFHSLLINHKVKPLLIAIMFSILFCVVGWLILDKCMDVGSREFLIEKFVVATDKDSDFLESRAQLFVAEETLFGDGAGRHAIYSGDYQEFVIADTCYQRLKQEVGLVGLIFHLLLFLFIIFKCVLNYRYLTFELSIMLFLMLSMIGADPLGTPDKHSFFYWLIIGRVSSFEGIKLSGKR